MNVRLGRHRIRQGSLDQFVDEWRSSVVPLRESFGFEFIGAWALPDSNEVVWVVGHEGDFEAVNADYYASPGRRALDPDPARHIEHAEITAASPIL